MSHLVVVTPINRQQSEILSDAAKNKVVDEVYIISVPDYIPAIALQVGAVQDRYIHAIEASRKEIKEVETAVGVGAIRDEAVLTTRFPNAAVQRIAKNHDAEILTSRADISGAITVEKLQEQIRKLHPTPRKTTEQTVLDEKSTPVFEKEQTKGFFKKNKASDTSPTPKSGGPALK